MILYMARLCVLGFGGSIALVSYMHRGLVNDRKSISKVKKYGKLPGVVASVDVIAAAAIGAIIGSVIASVKGLLSTYHQTLSFC